jgi:Ca2+-binding RTX toxin-like protein
VRPGIFGSEIDMANHPNTWLREFVTNTVTTGNQTDPDIVQLANGNILVAWTSDDDSGAGSENGLDIIGQIFDPLGNPVGDEFRVDQSYFADNEQNVDFAPLPDGGFLMTFVDEEGANGSSLRMEKHDATGSLVDSYSVASDTGTGVPNYFDPHVAVASATSAMVVYELLDTDNADIYFRTFDPATGGLGAETVAISSGTALSSPDIVALTNGNYLIVATNENNNTIELRGLNSTGGNVIGPTTVPGSSGASVDSEPSVTALSGGGFVISWTKTVGADSDVYYEVFDSSGGVVAAAALASNDGSADDAHGSNVFGLADGNFIVAYDDDVNGWLKAVHFAADGTRLGSATVSTHDGGPTGGISGIGLGDGRFAISWEVNGDIRTKILDSRDAINDPGVYTPDQYQIGTIGDDTFTADDFSKFIYGHDGNDTITESGQIREYYGGYGRDTLYVNSPINADIHDGGPNRDTIDWSGDIYESDGVVFDLPGGTASFGGSTETMTRFENLVGTQFADTIIGTGGPNKLWGYVGADTIYGRSGDDSLYGGSHTDHLYGGDGRDHVYGGYGNDWLWGDDQDDTLRGGDGHDTVRGGLGNDTLYGEGEADKIYGNNGNDRVYGGDGTDRIWGGGNDDVLFGGAQPDQIHGDKGNDRIYGDDQFDTLWGDDGNDILNGGKGNDTLYGGDGRDRVWGAQQDDQLWGGANVDTFVFRPGGGDDEIHDFQNGTDLLDLRGLGFGGGTAAVRAAAHDVGNDLLIDFGANGSVLIDNFHKAQLDSSDLILV